MRDHNNYHDFANRNPDTDSSSVTLVPEDTDTNATPDNDGHSEPEVNHRKSKNRKPNTTRVNMPEGDDDEVVTTATEEDETDELDDLDNVSIAARTKKLR